MFFGADQYLLGWLAKDVETVGIRHSDASVCLGIIGIRFDRFREPFQGNWKFFIPMPQRPPAAKLAVKGCLVVRWRPSKFFHGMTIELPGDYTGNRTHQLVLD